MANLHHLPKPSLEKPPPANLTDLVLQDFYHAGLNLGRFSGIIYCNDMVAGV